MEFSGASGVYITAENHTDRVCNMHYIISDNSGKKLADREEEILPFAITGKPCLVRTHYPVKDGMQARGRGFAVDVYLSANEGSVNIKSELKLPADNITNRTIIGSFLHNNTLEAALERIYPVEEDSNKPYYMDGDKQIIPEKSIRRYDCMGYVKLPAPAQKSYIDDGPRFNGVAYAHTVVYSEKEQDAYVELSAEPSIKLWVNGKVVFSKADMVLLSKLPEPVHLKRGENKILVKSVVSAFRMDSGGEFGFTLRLTDKNGETLKGIYN